MGTRFWINSYHITYRIRNHQDRLRDHLGLMQGWESVFRRDWWFLGNPKDSKNDFPKMQRFHANPKDSKIWFAENTKIPRGSKMMDRRSIFFHKSVWFIVICSCFGIFRKLLGFENIKNLFLSCSLNRSETPIVFGENPKNKTRKIKMMVYGGVDNLEMFGFPKSWDIKKQYLAKMFPWFFLYCLNDFGDKYGVYDKKWKRSKFQSIAIGPESLISHLGIIRTP